MSKVSPMTSLSDGRPFQVFATATENARSLTVRRRVCGTARSADDAERKCCRPGRSATCSILSVRYVGARPFRYRNASSASLNDIRCGAWSQCRRWSRGMIWSYRLALNTSHANRDVKVLAMDSASSCVASLFIRKTVLDVSIWKSTSVYLLPDNSITSYSPVLGELMALKCNEWHLKRI